MFKKATALLLSVIMVLGMTGGAFALSAAPTASTVLVNGEIVAFDAYNINDNNYFKLRDLAYILSGTEKQFNVGWNEAENAISLTSGQAYTVAGGEMESKGGGVKTPTPTSSKIIKDGVEVQFTAYTIDGSNYFKLRDIGQAFNFGVDWDGEKNAIVIDTSKGYTVPGETPAVVYDDPPVAEGTLGNTLSNLVNGGLFAESNGWIYYGNRNNMWGEILYSLHKIKPDGSNLTQLYSHWDKRGNYFDNYCDFINVVGNWVYYRGYDSTVQKFMMYKIRTDGTGAVQLTDVEVGSIFVIGDWIYYTRAANWTMTGALPTYGEIYRMKTDGTANTRLAEGDCAGMMVADGWIYYMTGEYNSRTINKMRTDGTGKTVVLACEGISKMYVVGDLLYYIELSVTNYRLNLKTVGTDGTGETILEFIDANRLTSLNFVGDWIYFTKSNSGSEGFIYKVRADGSELTEITNSTEMVAYQNYANVDGSGISDDFGCQMLNVIGDNMYFSSYGLGEVELWTVRTDGTGLQTMYK